MPNQVNDPSLHCGTTTALKLYVAALFIVLLGTTTALILHVAALFVVLLIKMHAGTEILFCNSTVLMLIIYSQHT
jgi:hypothetical protein